MTEVRQQQLVAERVISRSPVKDPLGPVATFVTNAGLEPIYEDMRDEIRSDPKISEGDWELRFDEPIELTGGEHRGQLLSRLRIDALATRLDE
jgi:hypothetical protein